MVKTIKLMTNVCQQSSVKLVLYVRQREIDEYSFKWYGDYWVIRFEKEEVHLRDLARLRYIIHLIDNRGKNIGAKVLRLMVEGVPESINYNEEQLVDEEGLIISSSENRNISQEEIEDLKIRACRYHHENNKLDNKSPESEYFIKHYADSYGIQIFFKDGCIRFKEKIRFDGNTEKARKNASKHIHTVLTRIFHPQGIILIKTKFFV